MRPGCRPRTQNCKRGWPILNDWKLREAVHCLDNGGVIAYPTESVYGLGCDPLNPAAVMRLLRLKQRSPAKGLILIAADFGQLRPFVTPIHQERMAPVLATWPGPHTWVLPAAPGTPWWLTGRHDSLAVRVTAHPLAAALCRRRGAPLVSTSANRSGHSAPRQALAARLALLPAAADLVLHGSCGPGHRPTPIRDARSGALLRA